ncbi:MAG: phosphoserine transaminase [Spirochaeta sp. LUC14_002_19_P3]|nr:MAG: phosphoserine transaminase [Spirochaeta sp. LUC14_002_19_P3]
MNRPVNFSAGPSAIPLEVLQALAADMLNYKGTGLSLIEVSHRGKTYEEVHNQALSLVRELLKVPESHSVLLIGGGATLQFSMLPMNLCPPNGCADYVRSGVWADKAIAEAGKIGRVNILWDGKENGYTALPTPAAIKASPNSCYLHITSNETIGGVQWKSFPEAAVLAADMSSDIFTRPIDVSQFGLIYAGAQKNFGPAGVTLVIIRNNLLKHSPDSLPSYLSYAVHAKANSLYNTPPVFSIWAMKLVLENLKAKGGIEAAEKRNTAKAAELYRAIDESNGFYLSPVQKEARSPMNIVWRLADENREAEFLKKAAEAGLEGLKGHRSVGGCRASLYNAVTLDGVKKLTAFMKQFEDAS